VKRKDGEAAASDIEGVVQHRRAPSGMGKDKVRRARARFRRARALVVRPVAEWKKIC